MNNSASEVILRTTRHASGLIMVPCDVPGFNFHLVLHTGRPLSYLSVATYEELVGRGRIDHIGGA